jgi:pimeloyl-ACP methyl ester carboxylesterase
MQLAPFEPMPYGELPALPRVAHAFFSPACRDERVRVRTPHFGDVTLAVRRYGGKKPGVKKLVCVHGLMTSSYSFRYLLERLGDECELIAPDLPGAGRSDAPDVPYGPEQLADLLAALFGELGLDAPPVLGNSMGGYLAMHLVNLHSPGVVTPRMRALDTAFRVPGARGLLDVLVSRDPRRWVWKNVHYYDESLKSREEVEEYSAPLQTPAGRRAFARYLTDTLSVAGMLRFERDLRARGGRFPVPLLLVYARRDPMVPPAVGERLAALVPAARLTWLERGSHFAHVDAPDDFLAAAKDFLLGGSPR